MTASLEGSWCVLQVRMPTNLKRFSLPSTARPPVLCRHNMEVAHEMSRGNNCFIVLDQHRILFPSMAAYMAETGKIIQGVIYSEGCKKDVWSPHPFEAHIRHREENKARNGLRNLAKLQRQ